MDPSALKRITIRSEDFFLEGLLCLQEGKKGAVLTHPHPLYGGDMHNVVVTSLAQAFETCGFTTLRFNFRGVGKSQGIYSHGKGESQDVLFAIEHLQELGKEELYLAGYSFGAWVNTLAIAPDDAIAQVMVAPPVAAIDFENKGPFPGLSLVVAGQFDEFAPPRMIKQYLPRWNPEAHLVVIDGADHFFFNHAQKIESAVSQHLAGT